LGQERWVGAGSARSRSTTSASVVGYARESVTGPSLDRQLRMLTAAGCRTVFYDRCAGRTARRDELAACLESLRSGDTLAVPSLERLTQSVHRLIALVVELHSRGVDLWALEESLDTHSDDGRAVFAALDRLIRVAGAEAAREGRAAARAGGQRLGRPPALTEEQVDRARQLLLDPHTTVASVSRLLGVGRATLYRHLPELTGGSRRPELAAQGGVHPSDRPES
jgi:DNA invertase Pin-like site-specific DNA recombinase